MRFLNINIFFYYGVLFVFLMMLSSLSFSKNFTNEKDVRILVERSWDVISDSERKAKNARRLTKIASEQGLYVNPETPLVTRSERDALAELAPEVCDVHFQQEANNLLQGKYSRGQWLQHVSKCRKCCRPYMSGIIAKHITKVVNGAHLAILFNYNKSDIKDDYKIKLKKLFKNDLNKENNRKVLLIGRSSNKGSIDKNMTLSKKRVLAIKELLLSKGYVKKENLTDLLFGSAPPRLTEDLAELYGIGQTEIKKTTFSGVDDGSFRINQSVIVAIYES